MPSVVTLEQIATQCGVSRAAVSFALRGKAGVSEKLRSRILAEAKKMGYRPNPLVAAHMSHVRSRHGTPYQATMAMLLFTANDPENQRKTLNKLHRSGATHRANQLGYNLECFLLKSGSDLSDSLARMLSHRGIHGILIGSLDTVEATLDFKWREFSTVALGFSMAQPPLHRACYDNYNGMGVLLNELLNRGYTRPALAIDATSDSRSNHYTLAQYMAWQRIHRFPRPVPTLVAQKWDEPTFHKWFKRHEPDVVITPKLEVSDWLENLGLLIPRDIAVATTFRQPQDSRSGMSQSPEDVAAAAVDLLVAELLSNERGVPEKPKLVFVPGRWQDGLSTRKRKRTKVG